LIARPTKCDRCRDYEHGHQDERNKEEPVRLEIAQGMNHTILQYVERPDAGEGVAVGVLVGKGGESRLSQAPKNAFQI